MLNYWVHVYAVSIIVCNLQVHQLWFAHTLHQYSTHPLSMVCPRQWRRRGGIQLCTFEGVDWEADFENYEYKIDHATCCWMPPSAELLVPNDNRRSDEEMAGCWLGLTFSLLWGTQGKLPEAWGKLPEAWALFSLSDTERKKKREKWGQKQERGTKVCILNTQYTM